MNAWILPSLIRCSSSSTAPNNPSSDSISDCIACGSDASSVASRSCIAAASIFSVERKSRSSSANRSRAHGRANSNRCVTSCIAMNVRKSVGSSDQSCSNCAMFDTTNNSDPGPDRGIAMSYCPMTRCPRKPSTVPTCAPSSRGESCSNIPLIACISPGTSGPIASRVASPIAAAIRCAAGSSSSRRPCVLAFTQSARRTGLISTTSVGASRPVNRATCSSAMRTTSPNIRWSSGVGAGSSRPSCAFAMPICRAISQFTGPDEDDITRCSSRNSGASANASGSPDPNGKSMPQGYGGSAVQRLPHMRASPVDGTVVISVADPGASNA